MGDRDGEGRFVLGNKSNGGRPPGFKGIARKIMRETEDGAELMRFALALMRDETADMTHRRGAHEWLSQYGLGRPVARHELEAHVSAVGTARVDVRALAAALDPALVAAMALALEAHPSLALPPADDDADE